ncbi:MAG: hypothetical protein ACRD2W_17880 [Acidimicrobiales bacterium]
MSRMVGIPAASIAETISPVTWSTLIARAAAKSAGRNPRYCRASSGSAPALVLLIADER